MRGLFSKQRGGQIAVAGVGQKDDDVLACVLGALCQLDGSPDSSTGGDAHQNAFLVADQAAGGKGVVIFDGNDLVVDLGVQHVGDEARYLSCPEQGHRRCAQDPGHRRRLRPRRAGHQGLR